MTTTGTLFIVAAPSGAGKTSLVRALIKALPDLVVSVSHTTRAPRPGETHGIEYYFIDDREFERLVHEDAFLEHARVFDRRYGTTRQAVQDRLAQGLDVILEIDWQGARQVRRLMPDTVGVFILPPSRAELEKRLNNRGQDSAEIIARRMRDAVNEISHYNEFDYLIVNDDFNRALQDMIAVVTARRSRTAVRKETLKDLLHDLLDH